ncbi:MAG: prephenate dehydrogenase/arogenate dehydrogenase family protein [Betaproteobacteria bacterium]|nr:prephenate dehydrogenase/arogenate dehydrogenase family protein [Betaproteobacteria bacterium]
MAAACSKAAAAGERLNQLGIIGIGMIGASVAAAARARGIVERIVAYSPGDDAQIALRAGLIDQVCTRATDCLEASDVVVLSAPVSSIVDLMPQIAQTMAALERQGKALARLTDTGSSKQMISAAAAHHLGRFKARFLAAHPIAGSERRGAAAANPDLFLNRKVLLCPSEDQDPVGLQQLEQFWQSLGARTALMEPALHDAVYAEVSHWPHAAAYALCLGIASGPHAEQSLAQAGAGLKDSTRIAASDAALWADILLSNQAATLASAQRHQDAVDALIRCIELGPDSLTEPSPGVLV